MKWVKPLWAFVALLTSLIGSNAYAHGRMHHGHHHHARAGVLIGIPLGGHWYWYYRSSDYITYPPVITVPSPPPVYIEQNNGQLANNQQSNYWWYYCQNPQGYYPYVKECPAGWQLVTPQPPDLH